MSQALVSIEAMCDMCDGVTPDEARFNFLWMIERFGWALQYVEAPTSVEDAWCYSIGLAERFSHPELVVVGAPMQVAGEVLNALGDRVRWGTRFQPGGVAPDVAGENVYLGYVHPVHFDRSVFASWVDLYEAMGRMPEAAALEVVLPGHVPMLSQPDSPIGGLPDD